MSELCRHCLEPIGATTWLAVIRQDGPTDHFHARCYAAANGLVEAPTRAVEAAPAPDWPQAPAPDAALTKEG